MIPVILDTDIGSDIDDTWALALLLNSPELDLKLVTTVTGDTVYRAKIAARMLEVAGRADVPVGLGFRQGESPDGPQAPWVAGYDLARYPGPVIEDGVGAMIAAIMSSPDPVTIIGIGPAGNLAAALAREPRIADRAKVVGMFGDVHGGYQGNPLPVAEYNVAIDVPAAQEVFTAPWDITITPLDTCGKVRLTGEQYRSVRDCPHVLAQATIENYRLWSDAQKRDWKPGWRPLTDPETVSTELFDTAAVYLALAQDLVELEDLGLRITADGHTVVDERAKVIHCATRWRDRDAFQAFLANRLVTREVLQ